MRVLYVEDLPVNVELMEAIFAMRPKLQLDVACNAEQGFAAARRDPPDLVLLDLHLPDGHGIELLQRMRSVPQLAHTHAVAVTADSAQDLSGTSFAETWHKPLELAGVLDRLDHLSSAMDGDGASDGFRRRAAPVVSRPWSARST